MVDLCVTVLTYNRLDYALRTIEALVENVYNEGRTYLHIADDGSGDSYLNSLVIEAIRFQQKPRDYIKGIAEFEVSTSTTSHEGYGANYNLAMQTAHSLAPLQLLVEDDWQLTRTLDISALWAGMQETNIGCLRLGYLGYTQPLSGALVYSKSIGHVLELNPDSPEPHVFAGHPRLETVAWARNVGPWPEHLLPGETEFKVAHIPNARISVGWPLDVVPPSGGLFAHIGTKRSY